ncbi:MAG: creatininase family protein [Planctomycetaceae bacterium]
MFLSELTWPDVAGLSKDMPVVIPIAAVEQHGHHLPVYTDSMLLTEIVRRTELALHEQILVAPLTWLGNSHHHMDFPGTLSAPPRVYLDLLVGLLDNLIFHGFKRLLLINGHGGNDVPGKQAIFEVRQKYRDRDDLLLLFSTYWALGNEAVMNSPQFTQHGMGHACEWETSMILRIAPQLVREYKNIAVIEQGNPFLPATRGWTTKDRSAPGHIGSPHLASAEKGETLFATFSEGVQQLLQRIIKWDGKSWEG